MLEIFHKPSAEIPQPSHGIGEAFMRRMSNIPPGDLPLKLSPNARSWYGILSTNEITDKNFRVEVGIERPNNYVVGVGFGSIFRTMELFVQGTLPKAIISTDVMPEIVLAGRAVLKKLAAADDVPSFVESVLHISTLDLQEVINAETNKAIKERLSGGLSYVENLFAEGDFPIGQGSFLNDRMIKILDHNFAGMHQLAQEGKIAICYMGVTSPAFLKSILALPGYADGRNVVYVSNIIDHITQRGEDRSKYTALEPLKVLETHENNNFTLYVHTNEQQLEYHLRVEAQVPHIADYCFSWYHR